MKNLLLSLGLIFSLNAMADEFYELDSALDQFISNRTILKGQSSSGKSCEVSRSGSRVDILSTAPGCINPVTRTINIDCSAVFPYHLRDRKLKELSVTRNSLVAIVKQEDDEQYSSAQTNKIEISASSRGTTFKVSSKKSLLGRYKYVQDCTVK